MTDFKLILFFLLLFGCTYSQSDTSIVRQAKGKTLRKLGKNALLQNDPSSAITFLEAYNKTNKSDAAAITMLGEAYMKVRDYERAKRTFLRAYETGKEKVSENLYYHALMMKSNGQYDSAKINFSRFKKEYKGKDKLLKRQSSREIVFCDSVQNIIGAVPKIVIQRLDTSINKINVEAAPANENENMLVYTSFRTEKKEYEQEDDTAASLKRKLYFATRKKTWIFGGEFGKDFNDPDYHTGNACFSPDRKKIYFTRCKKNLSDKMSCAIYVSSKVNGEWTEPVKLPKEINNSKYTSTMPAVTIEPVKGNEVLYFVSDRKGGKGGLDIWYTVFDVKKQLYKTPKNAGAKINTTQDEITPFFDVDTRTLYYSSNGLGGLGGYDIFKTKGDGKRWTGSENIGLPVNSGADDIYYTISTNREEGFFVSNRKGGNSLKNNTCCDDIYYYRYLKYIRVTLSGNVSDALDNSRPIAQATIEIFVKDKITQEKILVKTVLTDDFGDYRTGVEPGNDYFLVVKKEDYLGTSGDVTTQEITVSKNIIKDLQMMRTSKTPIRIPNVKYQYDRANIEESSKIAIDTTVLRLMQDNPELMVEIMAHTDSKGSDSYNLKLSQRRAESVVQYLVQNGIDAKRLKAKGYGESMPVTENENADGTDNASGRARNRRTDFKIIGVIDAEIINEEGE